MLNFLKKYSYLIGIFLFIIILFKIDIREFLMNIKNINIFYILFALLFSFPIIIAKSYCWNYIKKKQKIYYSQKDSFLMYGVGLYIGGVTPGRVGEASRVIYLTKDGYSLGKSLVSLILDRLSDFIFLIIFLFFGLIFYFNLINREFLIYLLIIISLIISFFVLLKLKLIKLFLKKIFYFLIPKKHKKSLKINFQDFIKDIKIYNFKDYLIILLITSLSWFFYYIQMYIIAQSVNINNIPLLHLSIILTVVGFITLIPISISGIGTRDAALIFFLTPLMIAKEQIIIFSSLILLAYFLNALIGFICWLIKPI